MTTPRRKPIIRPIPILAVLTLLAVGSVCQGWWPYGGLPSAGWFPGCFPRSSDLERLPHYTLFPPVYYSHPVPRTYGYNPFASLPELKTILEIDSGGPMIVRNPCTRSAAGSEASLESSANGPLVVRNPFVDRDKTDLDKHRKFATLAAPSK
jgi:hypothetical protein